MAYSVIRCINDGDSNNGCYYEYLCESADDIEDLPTGVNSTDPLRPRQGSKALIETDAAVYILKVARAWGLLIPGIS